MASEEAFASAFGIHTARDQHHNELPEDGLFLVEGQHVGYTEVKTQLTKGSNEARVREENRWPKILLLSADLEQGLVRPFVVVNPRGADIEQGELLVRWALWPPLGKRMKWQKTTISGVKSVNDLTVERLAVLKHDIAKEIGAYCRKASPEFFGKLIHELKLHSASETVERSKNWGSSITRTVVQGMTRILPVEEQEATVQDLGVALPTDKRGETVRNLGKTLPVAEQEATVQDLGVALPTDKRGETVRNLGKTLPSDQRRASASSLIKSLPSEEQEAVLRDIEETLSSEKRAQHTTQLLGSLPSAQKISSIADTFGQLSPEERAALLARLSQGTP